jgi:hypothetical protein
MRANPVISATTEYPFCWKHVAFYAFPLGDDGVELSAVLTFCYMKGMQLKESDFKRVPISLLSTRHAVDDTMRLLLVLALMDGVLDDGVNTWGDLMNLRPGEGGNLIRIKPSMADVPVLRKRDSKNVLSDLPEILSIIQREIRRLRYSCGFEHRLTAYAWRRAAAYYLNRTTTAENRKMIMGHKDESRAYSHYQVRVSDVDLQALSRGLAPKDRKAMLRVGLNRRPDAPTKISEIGLAAVLAHPQLVELCNARSELTTALQNKHGSIAAASRSDDPEFQAWKKAQSAHEHLRKALVHKRFLAEYKEFFVQAACPKNDPSVLPTGDEHAHNQGVLEEEYTATDALSSAQIDEGYIDPELLKPSDESNQASFESTIQEAITSAGDDDLDADDVPALDGLTMNNMLDDYDNNGDDDKLDAQDDKNSLRAQDGMMSEIDDTAKSTSRLHGLPEGTGRQQGRSRFAFGRSACDDLHDLLTAGHDEAMLMEELPKRFEIVIQPTYSTHQ